MTQSELLRGLRGMFARLKAEYQLRKAQRVPQPGTLFINPEAYDHMIEAMQIVNSNIGVPPPQDSLYTFKGMRLRRGK